MARIYVEELALKLGVSAGTINIWYRWKRLHPEHPLSLLLPDYHIECRRRVWSDIDLWAFKEFKERLPMGRNGILGDVTQKSARKKKKEKKENGTN